MEARSIENAKDSFAKIENTAEELQKK